MVLFWPGNVHCRSKVPAPKVNLHSLSNVCVQYEENIEEICSANENEADVQGGAITLRHQFRWAGDKK